MPAPARGEIWLVDFGAAGKTRPALIVSVNFGEKDRALITVVPHTTTLRDSPFEIVARAPFLKSGAFLVQGVTTFPTVRALHRLGTLAPQASTMSFAACCAGLEREEQEHKAKLATLRQAPSSTRRPLCRVCCSTA